MRSKSSARIAAEIAGQQAGIVSRSELIAHGISCKEIETLMRREALLAVRPGIYAYGTTVLTQQAIWWSALKLGRQGARLSGRSALEVRAILPPEPHAVRVCVPRRNGHGTRIVKTRLAVLSGRASTITLAQTKAPSVAEQVGALPADPVLRAIDDLAAAGATRDLRKAWREADYLGLLQAEAVRQHLLQGTPGASEIRRLLRDIPIVGGDNVVLLSRAERRLLEALSLTALPRPAVNEPIDFSGRRLRPDFWFYLAQLIIEVDGPGHTRPARAAEDEERDAHLRALGIEVLRFTDDEIWDDVDRCVGKILQRYEARIARAA